MTRYAHALHRGRTTGVQAHSLRAQVLALKMIRVLVAAQCSPFTPREPDDKTPAMVAEERGLTEIVAYCMMMLA